MVREVAAPGRIRARGVAWLRDERGSALVETALVLPVVIVIAMGVVMAGRIVQAKLGVQAAAREAARAVAEAQSPWDGSSQAWTLGQSAAMAHGLSPSRFSLYVDNGGFWRGGTVRAAAWYWVRLGDLPFVGRYQVLVSSTATERIELYRARTGGPP